MVDDAILSREAYLIYQNAWGFEPDQGSLLRWVGNIKDKVGKSIPVTVEIPADYPHSPPMVTVPGYVSHPNIVNRQFTTRSLSRWKSSLHIYQVMKEVNTVIHATNVKFTSEVTPLVSTALPDDSLQRQIVYLREQLDEKQRAYSELQSSGSLDMASSASVVTQITQDSLVELQNEMYSLEDDYDRADIDGLEFAKKFLSLQKRYYLLEKAR
ncbi:MAG: hypothetical protein IH840_05120 [Candidatus Heimdallarchaeota archaeon]|nr:hypothetical protein [Candidatus Heimdallarchaeota archaeon]